MREQSKQSKHSRHGKNGKHGKHGKKIKEKQIKERKGKAKQSKTKQNKAKQSKAKQSKAKQINKIKKVSKKVDKKEFNTDYTEKKGKTRITQKRSSWLCCRDGRVEATRCFLLSA
jgi:hypothetical protein